MSYLLQQESCYCILCQAFPYLAHSEHIQHKYQWLLLW